MAIEVVWDTVEDAEASDSLRDQDRIVRTAFVKGIDIAAVMSSKLALMKVLEDTPDIPDLGDQFDVAYPNYFCMHRVARGIPNTGGSMARLWVHYETPGGGGTPIERFAAEDSTVLVAAPTQKVTGTGVPLLVSSTGDAPDIGEATTTLVTSTAPRVMRSLVLYGLFSDRPSTSVLAASNKVNNGTWQGGAAGYWRCEGPRVRYSSRDGMYAVSVGFLTKMDEDWSTYEFAKDPTTGLFIKPDEGILSGLLSAPYAQGVQHDTDGILKVGHYETYNFASTFGVSFPIGD